jgi:hypothetical protein
LRLAGAREVRRNAPPKEALVKLQFDLLSAGRLELAPSGAFFRSFLHDRRGDPHVTNHWLPQPGNDVNTPHLTRRGQERVWLPAYPPGSLLAGLERLRIAIFQSWIRRILAIDFPAAALEDWVFYPSPPRSFFEPMISAPKEDVRRFDFSREHVMATGAHMLARPMSPMEFINRGPPTDSPLMFGARMDVHGASSTRMAVWLQHGAWDPYGTEEPVLLAPPGWYWAPEPLVDRRTVLRVLGPQAVKRLRQTMRQIEEFLGPPVRDFASGW